MVRIRWRQCAAGSVRSDKASRIADGTAGQGSAAILNSVPGRPFPASFARVALPGLVGLPATGAEGWSSNHCRSLQTSSFCRQHDAERFRRLILDRTANVSIREFSRTLVEELKMKRAIIGTFALSLAAGVAYAQDNAGAAGAAGASSQGGSASLQFSTVDSNGDGRISSAEAQAHSQLRGSFATLDANSDGHLSQSEFGKMKPGAAGSSGASGAPGAPGAPGASGSPGASSPGAAGSSRSGSDAGASSSGTRSTSPNSSSSSSSGSDSSGAQSGASSSSRSTTSPAQ